MTNQTKITVEPDKQEIFIEREFDGPRELVFKIMTDRDYVTQWRGPKGYKTEIDKADIRSGGEWRYVQTDQQGNIFAFHGVYHEVLPPSRVINTFEWEGLPEKGHVILETIIYEELSGNRTKLRVQQVFQSVNDRDGMLQSGMEIGMRESYERLDTLIIKLK
jgi:uncharacterized protein YndB with AHSA1/START domain